MKTKMTLKELLNSCDFKDVAPIIAKHYHRESVGMADFKIAFDTLRNMEPHLNPQSQGEIIELSPKRYGKHDIKDDDNDYYISVSCGGDFWESELAKEVVVSEELTLTNSEIAAHCLWELTYYTFGKLDEKRDNIFGEEIDKSNLYSVVADRLENKPSSFNEDVNEDYIRHIYIEKEDNEEQKEEKMKIVLKLSRDDAPGNEDMPEFVLSEEDKLRQIKKIEEVFKADKNNKKLSRSQRLGNCIKKLKRMARVEKAIRALTINTKSFTREEVEYLFKTNLIFESGWHSRAYNVDQRIDYLIDLFSNYVS